MDNIIEYFVHAQTVSTMPLFERKGPGDEAIWHTCGYYALMCVC